MPHGFKLDPAHCDTCAVAYEAYMRATGNPGLATAHERARRRRQLLERQQGRQGFVNGLIAVADGSVIWSEMWDIAGQVVRQGLKADAAEAHELGVPL